MRDTAEIRARMIKLWEQVEQRKISASEARLYISLARTILETIKVEIAAAHLNQKPIPTVLIGSGPTKSLPQ